MKKLLVLAFAIFAKGAFAQKDTVGLNVPLVNNTVVYERVFDAPNTPKNLLYSNAGLWFAETHPYGTDTQLQLADPALWRVTGRVKTSVDINYKELWNTLFYTIRYQFTVQVDCKDNKYRIRIYNILDDDAPADNLMFALINAKKYTLPNTAILKTADLKQHFQTLNTVINNVCADIAKGIMIDNSF